MRRVLAPLAGASLLVACGSPLPTTRTPSAPLPATAAANASAAPPVSAAAIAPAGTATVAPSPPASSLPPAAAARPEAPTARIEPGLYRCELERTVLVRRLSPDARQLTLQWQGVDQSFTAVESLNGALRYENASLGLVWIQIAGKSLLLDTRHGRQLANECRL